MKYPLSQFVPPITGSILIMVFGLFSLQSQNPPELVPFASGLQNPVGIANAGDERLFVLEKRGTIRALNENGDFSGFFLDIRNRVRSTGGEQGLLGLAFHPEFAENGLFFVNYTDFSNATVISRFSTDVNNPNSADPDSEVEILRIDQPFLNHNGGDILFGPDGYLYIFMGDGGSGGDPMNLSQNRLELIGKIIRIDVDNGLPYTIPEDNPFAMDDFTRDEIWALGLRNPWRNSFDRLTGDLWIADVGQNQIEEINFQPTGSTGGENYGWRCYEGTFTYDLSGECNGPFEFPVYEYTHGGSTGCSVTGGYVYRGSGVPELYGSYIFGDFCSGRIWKLVFDSGTMEYNRELLFNIFGGQLASFGEDSSGELYATHYSQGRISKLIGPCSSVELTTAVEAESCPGESDGQIELQPSNWGSGIGIVWSDGTEDEWTRTELTCGTYSFTITDNNNCLLETSVTVECADTLSADFFLQNDTLFATSDGHIYNWYFNDQLFSSGPDPFLIITHSGEYELEIIDQSGCSFLSGVKSVVLSNIPFISDYGHVHLFPNPFRDHLVIRTDSDLSYRAKIFDVLGRTIFNQAFQPGPEHTISTRSWPTGIYLVVLTFEDGYKLNYTILRNY